MGVEFVDGQSPSPAYKMHNDYLEAPWFWIDTLILLNDLLVLIALADNFACKPIAPIKLQSFQTELNDDLDAK